MEQQVPTKEQVTETVQGMRIHGLHGIDPNSKLACYVSCKVKTPLGFLFLSSIALLQDEKGFRISFPSRKVEGQDRNKDYFYMESQFKEILTQLAVKAYQDYVTTISQAAAQHNKRLNGV